MSNHKQEFLEHLQAVLSTGEYTQMISYDIREVLSIDDKNQLRAALDELKNKFSE